MARIEVTVDGVRYQDEVEPRLLLVHYLRDGWARSAPRSAATPPTAAPARCTSTAASVKSCSVLAVQADGNEITTIEGLAQNGAAAPGPAGLPRATTPCSAATARPGMIMAAVDLLKRQPDPTEEEIRHGLEGNLCRCTGYQNIVRAVRRGRREERAR